MQFKRVEILTFVSSLYLCCCAIATKAEGQPGFNSDTYVALTVIVPAGKSECFYYQPEGHFEVEYQVVKGGDFDIGLFVEDPEGGITTSKNQDSEGNVEVKVKDELVNKDYKICLDNSRSSNTEKKVYIEIDVDIDHRREFVQKRRLSEMPKEAEGMEIRLENFYMSVENVDENLRLVGHHQSKFRNIEAMDRSVMEDNFSRVNLWSGFQLTVMIIVGIFQVFLIRSLFDERNPLHKVWKSGHK